MEKSQYEKLPVILNSDDGYPTPEWIEFIEQFAPDKSMSIRDFLDNLKDSWWPNGEGFRLKRKYDRKVKLELHTNGWSGNEEMIDALNANTFLKAIYIRPKKWIVGGHYYYEVKVSD